MSASPLDLNVSNNAEIKGLPDFLVHQLKDILWTEKFLRRQMSEIRSYVTSARLRMGIENHMKEIDKQIWRLEEVFLVINEPVQMQPNVGLKALVQDAMKTIKATKLGSMVRDVCIINCLQKVEHYEIASYGTLKTLAIVLGHPQAADLLEQTLNEEKNADAIFSTIAEVFINEQAAGE
ncbi:YciE/YciF ferroxidase family protein [Solitalea canadensis]|uniref:Uncharacterized protein n=1 Tax=Solitalea canadensis (strain ATCC 29591 / DSM 3403 / JCM 21819 / LMG 8368 / NBRC 15130 / NCIMB 12057 / USAM 9D) TaxID=929556 RepID=H8KTM8_SOLCM|nr:DUF892 family protein [Solitalea canadensis]AFD06603.1 hypothetical protein Solca_1530 [Solitalea canadensis DSM 3403]